jgi:hypothetical protein
VRVGSTVLRLAAASELEVRRLDDERMVFELHSGSLAVRVRTRELAQEIELVTDEARLAPQRAGHYRLDRIDDSTQAGSWRGELRVLGAGGFDIATGEHVELWREGPGEGDERRLAHTRTPLPQDDFAVWALRADQEDTRSASARYVSPEMTGVEDLDRYGRWDRHPEYGAIWFPLVVAADWAPYRHGRWLWTVRWGWSWVDAAPWGFAPFHYGRWVHFGGRWAWAPGSYVRRPVYAPALVAWIGGPNFGISVNIGGGRHGAVPPNVGWVPLAPREVYRPWYRASPGHVHNIDRHHPMRPRPGGPGRPTIPERVDQRPHTWANQGAPGGVTVVPRDALSRREPVQRVVVTGPDRGSRPWPAREALPQQAPPARERPASPAGPAQMGPQRPSVVPPPWRTGEASTADRGARPGFTVRTDRPDRGPERQADPVGERTPDRRDRNADRPANAAPVGPIGPTNPGTAEERRNDRFNGRNGEPELRRSERPRPIEEAARPVAPRPAALPERPTVQRPPVTAPAPADARPTRSPPPAAQPMGPARPQPAVAPPPPPPPPAVRAPLPQRVPAAAPAPNERAEAHRRDKPVRERPGREQRAKE